MKSTTRILFSLLLFITLAAEADTNYFRCKFGNSVFVDATGVYEGPKWSSNGFTIQDDWIVLDKGSLKLKLTQNIQKFGIIILRGGEPKKGYQFSLENNNFIYVLLMVPNVRTWTVTGICKKDDG